MSLFAQRNFFIGFSSYWCSISSISFGAFQCSAQTLLHSPAEDLAEDNSLLLPYQPAPDRREPFTGRFQISPLKRIVKLCVPFQWTTSYMPLLPTFAYLFVHSLHLARGFFLLIFSCLSPAIIHPSVLAQSFLTVPLSPGDKHISDISYLLILSEYLLLLFPLTSSILNSRIKCFFLLNSVM